MDLDGPVLYEPQRHDVSGFDCGSEAQTRWLHQVARIAQATGTARVYVVSPAGQNRVVGYHALAAASVSHEDASPALLKSAGRSPMNASRVKPCMAHAAELASSTHPVCRSTMINPSAAASKRLRYGPSSPSGDGRFGLWYMRAAP